MDLDTAKPKLLKLLNQESVDSTPVACRAIVPVYPGEEEGEAEIILSECANAVQLKDTEQLRIVSEYSSEKEEKLKIRYEECKDMGFFSRVRDSKFPGVDNAFLNLFSLKPSNKAAILEKIKDFENVYQEIRNLAVETSGSEQVDCAELRGKILLLKRVLKEIYESANFEEKEASSKVIQKLHKSFMQEYHKLDCIVTDFENVTLVEMVTQSQNGLNKALKQLDVLSNQMEVVLNRYSEMSNRYIEMSNKFTDVCQKFDLVQGEALAKQDALIAQNKNLEEKFDMEREEASASRDAFITQIKVLEGKMDKEKEEASAKQDVLIAQNKSLEYRVITQNKNLEEKVDLMQREREEASAKQDVLIDQNKNLEKMVYAMMEKLEKLTPKP